MRVLTLVTLVLTTALIIAASYTHFEETHQNEINQSARMAANLVDKSTDKAGDLKKIEDTNKRITLINPDGTVAYDSRKDGLDNHADRPEVKQAMTDGEGRALRYSKTLKKRLYYCAVRLSDSSVLRFSDYSGRIPGVFYSIVLSVLFIMVLMYITASIAASYFTKNVVKPIAEIDPKNPDLDNVYEEIQPFLKRIAVQSAEIYRQTEMVTEQKAHLRTVMDNIDEGLVIIDKNGEVITINEPALKSLGVYKSDVRYKSYRGISELESLFPIVDRTLSGEKGSTLFECGGRTYQVFHSPVTDKDVITGCVLMLFDVTERTEAEKIRREFTANVSHELKTPITTIHGYAQIIDSGIARPDDVGGFVKKIEKESQRLMALVDDIIELSRLDEGTADSEHTRVALLETSREVAEALVQKAEQMQVRVNVLGNESFVVANASQISEMLYNLVDNAIKYNNPSGSVTITVSDGCVEVADTGIGIEQNHLDRIFERFFRADKSRSKKVNGTGLGLSIVKHLAKANGATVKVESRVGEGSIFKVMFDNMV